MKVPSQDNPYAFLACFLSPWKDAKTIETLAEEIDRGKVHWESLLHMANVHLCTPLWLVRLRKDGLLPFLPPDLRRYLESLHEANVARNQALRKATRELLSKLNESNVPAILLKGAASFCDDLYEDVGARMMVDIDVLVKPQHSELVRDRLLELGYHEEPDGFGESVGCFDSYAPHHLPPFRKPGTPAVIEVHIRPSRGQAGRVLPLDVVWRHSQVKTWEGLSPLVLAPSYRLLHHTAHALVPFGQFVGSTVSLAQLAEFAYLVARYGSALNWSEWFRRGASQGLGRQFRVYLNLAHELMAMPLPLEVTRVCWARRHVARVSVAANYRACLYGHQNPPASLVERGKWLGIGIYVLLHRCLTRPLWVWHNLCYKKGLRSVPFRLFHLFRFFVRRRANKSRLGRKAPRNTGKKMAFLLTPRHLWGRRQDVPVPGAQPGR